MAGVRDLTKITDHIVPELYSDSAVWKEFIDALFDSNYQILNNGMGKAPCLRTLADNEMVDCPKRVLPMYDLSDLPLQHDGGSLYNLMAACAQRGVRLSSDNDIQFSWELDKRSLFVHPQVPGSVYPFVNTGLKFSAKPYAGWDSKNNLNSRKFNQLIKNGDFNTAEDIWTNISGSDISSHSIQKGKMLMSGVVGTTLPTVVDRRYYWSFEIKTGTDEESVPSAIFGETDPHQLTLSNSWVRYSYIDGATSSETPIQFSGVRGAEIRNIWVVDLTYWGNAEISKSDFEGIYPSRYYEYLPIEGGPYGSPEMQNMYIAFYDANGKEIDDTRKDVYCLHNGVAQVATLSDWDTTVSAAASVKLLCSLPLDRFTWYLKFPTEDTRLVGQRSIPFFDECLAVTDRIAPGTETRRVTFEMTGSWTGVPASFIKGVGENWSVSFSTEATPAHVVVIMGGVDVTAGHCEEVSGGSYTVSFTNNSFTGNVVVRGETNTPIYCPIIMSGSNFTSDAPSYVVSGSDVTITINAATDAFIVADDLTITCTGTTPTPVQVSDSCVTVSFTGVSGPIAITVPGYKYHTINVSYNCGSSPYGVTCNSPISFKTRANRSGESQTIRYDADFEVDLPNASFITEVHMTAGSGYEAHFTGLSATSWTHSFPSIPALVDTIQFAFVVESKNYTISESIASSASTYANVLLNSTKSNTATIWDRDVDYSNIIDYVDEIWYDRDIRLHLIIDGIDRTSSLPTGASINYYMTGSTHRVMIIVPKNSVTSTLEFRYM